MKAGAPPRPFDEPWHAGAFALAVHLNERGMFTWPEWSEALSANLAASAGPVEGGDDYYRVWLDTVLGMAAERGGASAEEVEAMKARWTAAYEATPHGEPVRLEGGRGRRAAPAGGPA